MAFRVPRGGTVFTGVGGPSLIETRPGPNDVRLFASANHHANFVDAAKGRTQPASLWMLSTFLCGFAAPAPDPLGWRLGVAAWSFNHASQPIESIDTNHPKGHIP
jgi:hypothetical protein